MINKKLLFKKRPVGLPNEDTWELIDEKLPDLVDGELLVIWRLNRDYAETDDIPGVRIPNASFPGVISTMPGPNQLRLMLEREQELADAGGSVSLPFPDGASPSDLCGPNGTARSECLRTIPPREHGGNMDIRYLQAGVSIYLPCYVAGCGLAIGDLHFAQGDGEASGDIATQGARDGGRAVDRAVLRCTDFDAAFHFLSGSLGRHDDCARGGGAAV